METKTLAGHSELETTQRYMHLTPRALRGAVDRLEGSLARGFGDGQETRNRESQNSSDLGNLKLEKPGPLLLADTSAGGL